MHMRRLFKAVIPLVLAVALPAVYGCTGMVQDELDATHAKLEALQKRVQEANRQMADLNAILAALDNSRTIVQGSFSETGEGYDITFRDGQTIHIHYGVDGADGQVLIPVGVQFEDGYYYWQVDGEWLLDADGNMVRAGATDGVDGIAPQIKVEDGYWWISTDGGETFEQLASCEEMDGVGVFSGVDTSDPGKTVLILWDGTRIEIPRYVPLAISLPDYVTDASSVMDTLCIAPGEKLRIRYEVTAGSDQPVTVTSGTDGVYFSRLVTDDGFVEVQAPDPFCEGYILLSAWCNGSSAIKMISFREREIPAKDLTVRIGSGGGLCEVPYEANFEYTVSGPDADWLEVMQDPGSGTIRFRATRNEKSYVRFCTVTVSPKDNPGYVCTTILVKQATDTRTFELEAAPSFKFDTESLILDAPAEGGEADIWITSRQEIIAQVPVTQGWVTAGASLVDGFWKLHIKVDALDADTPRSGVIRLRIRSGGFLVGIGEIKINQK